MLFILDKRFEVIDTLSNKGAISNITPFFDDEFKMQLETGAETYEFSTLANTKESQHLVVGNHVAFQFEGKYKLFTIVQIEESHNEYFTKSVYCEMAGIELINEIIRPMDVGNANLSKFIDAILVETSWKAGNIDLSIIGTHDFEITDYTNVYSLLQEHVVGTFGGELSFTVDIKGGRVANRYVNVYAKRGHDNGYRFSYTSNLSSVVRTVDSSNLATALIGVGKGIDFKEIETSDKPLNQDFIADEESYRIWNKDGSHILGVFKCDTESPHELLKLTRKELEKRKNPNVKYELKTELLGSNEIEIGSTVTVTDLEFNPPIQLSARVNELTISLTDPSKNECVLSNFTELNSNISQEMREMASELEGFVEDKFNSKFPIGTPDIEDDAITGDKISDVYTQTITTDILVATEIKATEIITDYAEIIDAEIKNLKVDNAEIKDLVVTNANITNAQINDLKVNSAEIKDLVVTNSAEIKELKVKDAYIDNIFAGNITSDMIQTGTITAGSGIISDGAIGSAQISDLNADKITAGKIDTSKVEVTGENGHLRIKGNRLQVFEGLGNDAKERVSLGDVNGDKSIFGLRVRGADGKTILLDENGVKSEGITNGAITNDKISNDAQIDGGKLNINSVVNKINEDGTEVIKGTKIEIDGTNLSTKLSTITNKQDEQGKQITNNTSSIKANEESIKLKVDEQKYTTDINNMTSKLEKNTSDIEVNKNKIALKVEQTDIENAKSELINTVDTKISSAKAEIKVETDKITQNVSKLDTEVKTKADGSTVTSLSNKVATIETNVNSITQRVSSTENTVTTINGKVDKAQTDITNTNNKIDNLEIGGTNLVLNSAPHTTGWSWAGANGSATLVDETTAPKGKAMKGNFTTDGTSGGMHKSPKQRLEVGKKYSWSIWLKTNRTVKVKVGSEQGGTKEIEIGTSWKKITHSFVATETTYYSFVMYVQNPKTNDEIFAHSIKVEEGAIPTSWTIAPEDINADIEKNNTEISNTKKQVSSIETDLKGITSRVEKTESDIKTVDGKVVAVDNRLKTAESKITDEAITNTVKKSFYTKGETDGQITSKGYQTESQVQQTVNKLEMKFEESGGYNYLLNGDFKRGLSKWSISSGSPVVCNGNVSCPNGMAIQMNGKIGENIQISQYGIELNGASNETFTVSYYTYVSGGGSDGSTNAYRRGEFSLDYTDGTKTWHGVPNVSKFDTWEKVSITIKPEKRITKLNLTLLNRDTSKTVYYSACMIEKGEISNEWSPNPNEVYSGITSIDKDGITVSSTNSNTQTKIDNSSFRVENTTGGTIAEFSEYSNIPNIVSGVIKSDEIYAPNIVSKSNSSNDTRFIYVDGANGNDNNTGAENSKLKTVQKAISLLDDVINQTTTIYIYNSVTGFDLKSKTGSAKITFSLQDNAIVNGRVLFGGVTNRVAITNESGNRKATLKLGLAIYNCVNVDVYGLSFRGLASEDCNIYVRDSNYVAINSCDLGGLSSVLGCAIKVQSSLLWVYGCVGSNITDVVGQYAFSQVMMARAGTSKCPDYKSGLLVNYDGAGRIQNWAGGTFEKAPSSGWNPEYVPSSKTQTWSFNKIWSDETLNGWSNKNELIQGYASTWNTGRWTGYMQMTDDFTEIRNVISGATNLSGRIYVQRRTSSGNSTGSRLCLYGSDGTTVTTSTTINQGQGVWVALNSSIVQKIQSGAIKYFYLKEDSNNTSTYFKCESNAKIELTYTK